MQWSDSFCFARLPSIHTSTSYKQQEGNNWTIEKNSLTCAQEDNIPSLSVFVTGQNAMARASVLCIRNVSLSLSLSLSLSPDASSQVNLVVSLIALQLRLIFHLASSSCTSDLCNIWPFNTVLVLVHWKNKKGDQRKANDLLVNVSPFPSWRFPFFRFPSK